MENLAEKILNEKINEQLAYIKKCADNGGNYRDFIKEYDILSAILSYRQFGVIERNFKIKKHHILCKGLVIDKFNFGEWTIEPHYNDRFDTYELIIKHKDYIEDDEKRFDFYDRLMGYIA